MTFLLAIMSKLGDRLLKLVPYFLAYKAGKSEAKHDFDAAVNKVLEEDNEELRNIAIIPPSTKSSILRDRAKAKRKDQD
jgi:hypothetical protein